MLLWGRFGFEFIVRLLKLFGLKFLFKLDCESVLYLFIGELRLSE